MGAFGSKNSAFMHGGFLLYEFISNLLVALLPIFEMGAGLNNYVSSMYFYVFVFYQFLNCRLPLRLCL